MACNLTSESKLPKSSTRKYQTPDPNNLLASLMHILQRVHDTRGN